MSATSNFTPGTPFDPINVINKINNEPLILKVPSSRPLPPTITVNRSTDGQRVTINISCVLFISIDNAPSDSSMPQLTPYYLVTDTNKVFIYISETAGNSYSFTSSKEFNAYHMEFSFSPNDIANLNDDFTKIEVIHWDSDPRGSRGTETVVDESA